MSSAVASAVRAATPRTGHLGELHLGERATVVEVCEPGATGERLLEMGLTAGTEVQLLRRALFGDPLLLWVRGAMLGVRRAQASMVRVQREG